MTSVCPASNREQAITRVGCQLALPEAAECFNYKQSLHAMLPHCWKHARWASVLQHAGISQSGVGSSV